MVGQAPYPSPIVASAPGIATSNQAGAAAPAIQQSQLRYPLLGGHAPPSPNAASAAAAAAAVSSTPPPYHPHGQPRYHPVYHPVYHHANLPALPLTMALAPTMTAAAPPPLPPPLRPTASAAAAAAVAAAIQRAQGQPGGFLWEQPPPQQLHTNAHIHTQAGEIRPARSLSRMAATITQPHHRADPITASAVKAPAAEFELQQAILQAQIRTGGGGGSNFTDLSATTAVEEDPRHLSVAAAAVIGQVLGKNSFEKKEEGVSEPPAIEKKKSRKVETAVDRNGKPCLVGYENAKPDGRKCKV